MAGNEMKKNGFSYKNWKILVDVIWTKYYRKYILER